MSNSLCPQHQKLIDDSAIDPVVAAARGYRSVTTKAELKRLGFSDFQCRVPALLVPVYSVHGNIAAYQIRPDDPRIDKKKGKAIKYETIAGSKMVIDIPPGARAKLGDPATPLFVTEGVRKADAAVSRGLCCIDLLGVWNWRGTNEHGGKTALSDWELIALSGRHVYLAFDSDIVEKTSVQSALQRLSAFLESRDAKVHVVILQSGPTGEKVGLDDFFASGRTVEDLVASVAENFRLGAASDERQLQGRFDRLIVPVAEGDLHALTVDLWRALAQVSALAGPTIFRHGDSIARIERTMEGDVRLGILQQDTLRRELVRMLEFVVPTDSGMKPVHPPMALIGNLLAWPEPPLHPLVRIAHVPVFARSGKLVLEEGYDPDSSIYLALRDLRVPPVPEHPSDHDLACARDLFLTEILGDFPFVGPADRANAVAVMLLPFLRELISGPTPIHIVEKPSPGTGAGLLTEMLTLPALGRAPALMTEGRDEDEWRKRLTAVLCRSPTFVVIDNLRDKLDSAALSAVLTATTWEDRLLGHSRIISVPVRCTWIATGNNPALSHEMARRAVPIRLDAQMDRPWERSERTFRHPELRHWASEHRADLVWAAIVIVRRWLADGKPPGVQPSLGSYESYASVVGGVLHRAGIDGFLSNLDDFYSHADEEGEAWRVVAHWWLVFCDKEMGTGEIWNMIQRADLDLGLGIGTERAMKTKLGILLRQMRGRRCRILVVKEQVEVRLEHVRDRQGTAQYRLTQVGEDQHRGPDGPDGPSAPVPDTESRDGSGPGGPRGPSAPVSETESRDLVDLVDLVDLPPRFRFNLYRPLREYLLHSPILTGGEKVHEVP